MYSGRQRVGKYRQIPTRSPSGKVTSQLVVEYHLRDYHDWPPPAFPLQGLREDVNAVTYSIITRVNMNRRGADKILSPIAFLTVFLIVNFYWSTHKTLPPQPFLPLL